MSYTEKELIKQLAQNPNKKTDEYSQNAIKSLFGGLIQQMLESEIEEYLGYSKYDYTNKNTTNSHNGKSKKTVKYHFYGCYSF
ncbi:transposase (plasmid) [Clostridium perfringens]|nr:transposase [Clostridium perfringens]